jgi:hypothetical protein
VNHSPTQQTKTPPASKFDAAVLAQPHQKRGKPLEGKRLRRTIAKRIRGTASRNARKLGFKLKKDAA